MAHTNRSEQSCPPVIQALYDTVRNTLELHGVAHGKASVVQLPEGSWVIVAAPEPLPTLPEELQLGDESAALEPGGGSFGGGGASGKW